MSRDNLPQRTVGSLFAGIGGFDLGFERAGFQIRFQVEIDEYCRKVLEKHWPDVRRYGDIRTVTSLPYVDVICGGFPCQDISNAGKREGIDGERSSLWGEMLRCIRLVRPRYVVVENVAALLGRGMGRVLGDLSACGYDAEWDCIPASAVGAPHRRDRVWIVAYAGSPRRQQNTRSTSGNESANEGRAAQNNNQSECHGKGNGAANVADAARQLFNGSGNAGTSRRIEFTNGGPRILPDARSTGLPITERQAIFGARRGQEGRAIAECDWWAAEPDVGRVAHGIPFRVDRLKASGNALVPQIAEWIARRILEDVE